MSHAQLSILMHRNLDTGEWYVERIDAELDNLRNQTRFRSPYPMRFALSKTFQAFLLKHLPVRLGPSVVTLEKASMNGVDLGMDGMRIVAQKAFSGLQSVVVRIPSFVGYLTELLSEHVVIGLSATMGLPELAERARLNELPAPLERKFLPV